MNILAGEKNLELLFSDMPLSFNDKLIKWKEDEDSYNSMLSSLGELSELEIELSKKQTDEWAINYKLLLPISIDSDEVQEKVKKHYFLMNSLFKKIHGDSFKGIGYEGYLILAEQTISNPVTKAVYENYQSGMAEHLYEAMVIFADKELKGKIEQYRQVII